jgi:ferredoxin
MYQVDRNRCASCGLCVDICPVGAISQIYEIDKNKCTDCGQCQKDCPVSAIDFVADSKNSNRNTGD